jgi:hypothetical protein
MRWDDKLAALALAGLDWTGKILGLVNMKQLAGYGKNSFLGKW